MTTSTFTLQTKVNHRLLGIPNAEKPMCPSYKESMKDKVVLLC